MEKINLQQEIEKLSENRDRYEKVHPGYITHIRFPRYKNISDGARIDFTFPVTALVGSNGSGKTSVLNALYGAPAKHSTGQYWFSSKVDPIEEGDGSPSRYIYGHYNRTYRDVVETRKARVRKKDRSGRLNPNYWEPTKESSGDEMVAPELTKGRTYQGRSKDRWNPVSRKVLYINFRKELSAFDKYFYFGKDPALRPISLSASGEISRRRIANKMDQVRSDAVLLARVIDADNTSVEHRGQKVATENRLLSSEELCIVSFVLGRTYEEVRWIKHRLFKGDGGLSILFKTAHGRYSEAFAGSGEVAVTSCVVQVLKAERGTLVLLDEPEVSLHPGAQERLLAFLIKQARIRQLQIIFSTHSPHLVTALPDDAIKSFHQLNDGRFAVIPSTHPYAAFRRLGATGSEKIRVIVEDRLAQFVVEQALRIYFDEAERGVFSVEYLSGGAGAILKYQIPVLMMTSDNTLILLDGDQRFIEEFVDPKNVPESEDGTLELKIFEATKVKPEFTVDGGAGVADHVQRAQLQRKYLEWIKNNLAYIPTSCPEEFVLKAAGLTVEGANSQEHKQQLREHACELYGAEIPSARVDFHGQALLAQNKDNSRELIELAEILKSYLRRTRP